MIKSAHYGKLVFGLSLLGLFVMVALILPSPKAQALSGSDFKSGRIIDDALFFNKGSMSVQQIQDFLNAKVPVCDRNKQISFNYGGKTYGPPFTCLKEFQENPTTRENNNARFNADGSPYQVPGGKSAAQIIWDAGQTHGINPQVIIVMLQKETGLITDTWAAGWQYDRAMGYACPDSGPNNSANCDTSYYGFYNQVNSAAWQLKRYTTNPNSYNFKAGVNRNVQFNPSTSCGSSPVYLENAATAALYNYTPYQPNPAALAVMNDTTPGGTVTCGAYGNRNFFWYFNKWFGSTWVTSLPGCNEATNTKVACVWRLKNPTTQKSTLVTTTLERDIRFINGESYEGVEFFGNVAADPNIWNIPVYRITKPDGGQFLTTSIAEKNVLVTSGYTYEGIEFYADPPGSNSGYPVYRMYSSANNEHRYVSDLSKRDALLNQGYINEGEIFSALPPTNQVWVPDPGKEWVYRFGEMPGSRAHFWTTGLYERDELVRRGYRYEGVSWQSLKGTTGKPIYRLYSPTMLKHLYTTDANERDQLSQTGYWTYEGVSQYMSNTATDKPVYRLYSPITTNHLWTTNIYERDALVANGTFRYEGVAWYQP